MPNYPATLTIKDKSYRTMNRWVVPRWLVDEYCNNDVVVADQNEVKHVDYTDYCRGCDRKYKKATKPTRQCSNSSTVNRHFGFVVPLCIDCYWYIEWCAGGVVPPSIGKLIHAGFRPKNIDHLL